MVRVERAIATVVAEYGSKDGDSSEGSDAEPCEGNLSMTELKELWTELVKDEPNSPRPKTSPPEQTSPLKLKAQRVTQRRKDRQEKHNPRTAFLGGPWRGGKTQTKVDGAFMRSEDTKRGEEASKASHGDVLGSRRRAHALPERGGKGLTGKGGKAGDLDVGLGDERSNGGRVRTNGRPGPSLHRDSSMEDYHIANGVMVERPRYMPQGGLSNDQVINQRDLIWTYNHRSILIDLY